MNIDIGLLKSFLAIADHGSFLAASNAVARSPGAISMQMKKLEEEIGQTLFTRDARKTELTAQGERLLPYARRMLLLESEIRAAFDKTTLKGTVKLGVPDDVIERFPMKVLTTFATEYPDVSIGIFVDHTPALIEQVDKGKLDVSIITYAPSIPGVKECERVTREPEVWAMAVNGIASQKTPLPITLWDKSWAWHEPVIQILKDAGIAYNIVLECENITGRKSAIEADLAVGPLPASQLDKNLAEVPSLQKLPPLPDYGLGIKLPNDPKPEVDAVANHLRQYFKQSEIMSSWKYARKL